MVWIPVLEPGGWPSAPQQTAGILQRCSLPGPGEYHRENQYPDRDMDELKRHHLLSNNWQSSAIHLLFYTKTKTMGSTGPPCTSRNHRPCPDEVPARDKPAAVHSPVILVKYITQDERLEGLWNSPSSGLLNHSSEPSSHITSRILKLSINVTLLMCIGVEIHSFGSHIRDHFVWSGNPRSK